MGASIETRIGQPRRPLGVTLINQLGRLANAMGIHLVTLDEKRLLEKAMRKARSSDFGGDDFREGLRRFLHSAESEADLSLLGRLMVQRYTVDNLANRLRLVDWRKKHPEIANEEIVAPLFIVGLPRTGTTILHALLEQDPANRSPLFWEVQFPVPPATPQTWNDDPRIAEDEKILRQLYRLVPGFEAMHPMGATMPQECVAVFTMCFMSEQLQVQFDVPSYQAWLDEQDMHPTYEFHKRFLQHLQSGGVRGGRWVLKSPAHLHLIDTLVDVFPDARIIHTHRDPLEVCASVASLTAALRGASTDVIDLEAIGRQQLAWWAKLIEKSLEQRKRLAHRSEQFFDVKMSETVADPLDVVRRMYAHFGYPLTAEVEARMLAFMGDHTRDKHGLHSYSPTDFGIDPERDRGPFEDYIDYFGLAESEQT
ncbi:MAG: sulfotransferase [Polyangiales bacterium]